MYLTYQGRNGEFITACKSKCRGVMVSNAIVPLQQISLYIRKALCQLRVHKV